MYTNISEGPIEFEKNKNYIIVDGLIEEAERSKYMGHLLWDGSHHDNATLTLVSHRCFGSGDARRQHLQFDQMVLFCFSADKNAVHGLARQIAPGNVKSVIEVYNDATSDLYRPLIVDLTVATANQRPSLLQTSPLSDEYSYLLFNPLT